MTNRYYIHTTIIFFLFFILYILLIGNLYLIQIKRHDFYKNLARQQYHVSITTPPPRAPILDRTGKQLAMNKDSVAAFLLPTQIANPERLEPFLQQYFPQAFVRLHAQRTKNFMYIKRRLTQEQQQLLEKHNITDIKLLHEPSRFYSIPTASSLIGLTDIDNNGLFGIEFQYNDLLRGKPTTYWLERDARSGYFYFKKKKTVSGHEATAIQLTIDGNLQFFAADELNTTMQQFAAQEGAVIIMNPANGDILAMASIPHIDPNNTKELNISATKNKAITDAYELGSVFKVFAALACLEAGVVIPNELIDCKNKKTVLLDGRTVNTWRAHGVIPFTDVVALSNNIGMAIVAKRLGERLYDHYIRMGFGSKTGIVFPGENKGIVNPPHNWSKQSIISLSYGYEISTTLLQLATAFGMIANNGYKIKPRLVLSQPVSKDNQPLYAETSIDAIKNILEQTTLRGTTKRAGIKGYKVMSKTGTANMLVNGLYDTKKNIYTCGGIIEKNNYQRVIVVFIKQVEKKGLYAAAVTTPLFERIATRMLIHDRIIQSA